MVTYQCHISLLHIESHITAFMKTFSCLTLHPMMGARHTSSLYEFMDGLAARSFSASLASTIIEGGATEGGRTRWAPPFIIPPLPFSCVVSPPFCPQLYPIFERTRLSLPLLFILPASPLYKRETFGFLYALS